MPSQAVLELLIQMRDEASSGLSSIGGAMGNVGMIAGGAALAGVVAFGAALVGGVQDAQASRELLAQTEQTIKTTGSAAGMTAQQIVDMASAMSDAAGKSPFGDDAIQRAENTLLTFTNIGKDVFPQATQATLDMAAALKTTPEAMDTLIGKALNTADGYKTLKKSGVDFTEQQAAQIDAMFAAGNAAGAQALILEELNKKYGGQAEAQAKAAGGLVQFKAGLSETFETLGSKLLPVLDKFGVWLNSPEVQQNISIFADKLGKGIEVAADFLVNDLIPAITDLYNFLAPILGPIIAEIARALSEDLPRGIDRVVTGWNTMKQALSDFKVGYIDPIVRGWEAVSNGISIAYGWFEKIGSSISSIQIPSWLQGHSPPPLANWFSDIAGAADAAGGAVEGVAPLGGTIPSLPAFSAAGGAPGGIVWTGDLIVQGSVVTERDLILAVRDGLAQLGRQNVTIFAGQT